MWEESAERYSIASMTAPSVPFTAFTEAARQAVVLARGDAYALGQERLGTEHLLLGLLGVQDGLAAQVLSSFDVTPEVVRDGPRASQRRSGGSVATTASTKVRPPGRASTRGWRLRFVSASLRSESRQLVAGWATKRQPAWCPARTVAAGFNPRRRSRK